MSRTLGETRSARRARTLGLIAFALALVALLGACGGNDLAGDEEVAIYVSLPLRGSSESDGRDAMSGAKLALADAGGRAGDLPVRAIYLDDTEGAAARARWSPVRVAANARRATADSTAIAYIGDFESGATRTSLPITNAASMLQVSPASSAVDLVRPFPGSDEVPEDVQSTGDRTFGRVIPDDEAQAEAGALWVKRLRARRVAVVSDRTEFGELMAGEFEEAAERLGLTLVGPRRSDLSYIAAGAASDVVDNRQVIGTDALFAASPSGPSVRLTSAAQDPSQLPPAGQDFVAAYREAYGEAPGRYAAYGYEAMAVVLDSIERAGDSGEDRSAVIDAFLETEDRDSILGTYSIDEVGDTTLDRLAGYRIVAGQPRFEEELSVP